ncbi:hypothetical protein ACWEK5_17735 [Rhodococcus koreensis]
MLVGRGITAWQRALNRLTCDHTPARGPGPTAGGPAELSGALTAELIDILTAVTLAAPAPIRRPIPTAPTGVQRRTIPSEVRLRP